jgi:hypothetical protein
MDIIEKQFIAMLDKALAFQRKHFEALPAYLHHYIPTRKTLASILSTREMWASHAYDMADKKELWHGADLVKERVQLFKARYPEESGAIAEFLQIAHEVANPFTSEWTGEKAVFVVSLTEGCDSKYHWENYACNGTGFCLDFRTDASAWKNVMDAYNLQLIRVMYDRLAQVQLIDEVLDSSIEHIKQIASVDSPLDGYMLGMGAMGAALSAVQVLEYYIVSYKQGSGCETDYTVENEWRLVYGMRLLPHPLDQSAIGAIGAQRRFAQIPFNAMNPLLTPTGVRIGNLASPRDRMRFESLAQRHFQGSTLRSQNVSIAWS